MDSLLNYAWLLMPFVWWPVALVGAWSIYKKRSLSVALITLGSTIYAALGSLNALFGHRAVFDSEGKLVAEIQGLVSSDTGLTLSILGALCLVSGIVLLLWRSTISERDA
jgi:hypothetical protein